MRPFPPGTYAQQWLLCAAGIFFIALGVSVEVMANLVTTAGEGIVLAICKVVPVKFGNMKMAFDITLVCISIVLSLSFLGQLTVSGKAQWAAALLVGQITKRFQPLMKTLERAVL